MRIRAFAALAEPYMNFDQKAQEISLILIKISVYVRRRELRERFERLSFDLLEHIARRNLKGAGDALATLRNLVDFASTIYEIEPVNAKYLGEILGDFNSAIRQLEEGVLPDSRMTSLDISLKDESPRTPDHRKPRKNKVEHEESDLNPATQSGNGGDNAAIRQSAILQRIKELPHESIQLKDLMGFFPGVSERTLRYDLQRLSVEGRIERIGQGGPATYYKARIV
jgi:hypothetical protein